MGRNFEANGKAACVEGGEGLGSGSVSLDLLSSSLEDRELLTDILHNAVSLGPEAFSSSINFITSRNPVPSSGFASRR